MSTRTLRPSWALAVALFGAPTAVMAEPAEGDSAAAANAFQQAQRAELSRNHALAAEMYELAYDLMPSAPALRSAVRNYRAAGEDDRAASLASTLRKEYADDKSQELATEVLEEAAGTLVTIEVTCDTPCTVSRDDRALAHVSGTEHRIFTVPGVAELSVVFDRDRIVAREVDGTAGETVEIAVEAPEIAEPEPDPIDMRTGQPVDGPLARARLSPAWFIGGAVATVGLAGATAWSGIDVMRQNEDYEAEPTQARLDAGQDAELRTNVLIGVTAAVGVATVALAIMTDWDRWKKDSSATARARVLPTFGPNGGGVSLVHRF